MHIQEANYVSDTSQRPDTSKFDSAYLGAALFVAFHTRWGVNKLKGLPPDLLQNRGHELGYVWMERSIILEFHRNMRKAEGER